MKNKRFLFISFSVISACLLMSANPPKIFRDIQPSTDATYGYSPENPVKIKTGGLGRSIDASHYFISRLRSSKGNTFKLLYIGIIDNPNYKETRTLLRNRFTNQPLFQKDGPLLDVYVLLADSETDTVLLYVNPYAKAPVWIPRGLIFENE